MDSTLTTWSALKSFVDARSICVQYIEESARYVVWAIDGPMTLKAIVDKQVTAPVDSDQKDFEDNYKTSGNARMQPTDTEMSPTIRLKAAPKGWTYHMHGIQFETSKLASLNEVDETGTAESNCTLKFYDDEDTELTTQASIDTDCVKTILDFEPTYDYEIIGGTAQLAAKPTNSVCIWVVAVPDLTYAQGGSRVMASNIDYKFLESSDKVRADGRVSKHMTYDATYHTNKLRIILRHTAGEQHCVQMIYEMFKA